MLLLSGEKRKSPPTSKPHSPVMQPGPPTQAPAGGGRQEGGTRRSRKRQGWTLDTRAGKQKAGPVCPGPPLICGQDLVTEKFIWRFRLQPSISRQEYDAVLLCASVSLLGAPSRVGSILPPPPPNVHIIIPGTCECCPMCQRYCKCGYGKDLNMEKLFRTVPAGCKCCHMCLCKREAHRDNRQKRRRQWDPRSRDWRDVTTSRGTRGATRNQKGPGSSSYPEPPEGVRPCWHPGFSLVWARY